MSFVIFIVLAVIVFGIRFADRSDAKYYNRKNEKKEEEIDNFFSRYAVSQGDFSKVDSLIHNLTQEIDDFSKELESIIGNKPTLKMLQWGFIARSMGKIPPRWEIYDETGPFTFRSDVICKNTHPWSEMEIEDIRNARLRFLVWYDKELINHGLVKNRLIYIPCINNEKDSGNEYICRKSNAIYITECKKLEFPAVVYWESAPIVLKQSGYTIK